MSALFRRPISARGFIYSRWFIFLLGGASFLLLFALVKTYYANYRIREQIADLQLEAERLKAKKLETLEMLRYAKSPAFVEEKARTELNLQKEGEQVAVFPAPPLSASNRPDGQSDAAVVNSSAPGNPAKWWQYFFGSRD